VLHVHDYRERQLRAEPGAPVTRIVRHDCADCDAVWQTLPEFLARHLWRTWPVVEQAMMGESLSIEGSTGGWPRVPERTVRRWRYRWNAAARFLAQVFATCGEALWVALAAALGLDATRGELVEKYVALQSTRAGQRLGAVAAQVDRLHRGVRLM
jgi:hypothetical protein